MAKIFEIQDGDTIYEIEADDNTTEGQAVVFYRQNVLGGSPGRRDPFAPQKSEFPGRAPGSPDPTTTGGLFNTTSSTRLDPTDFSTAEQASPYSPPSLPKATVEAGQKYMGDLNGFQGDAASMKGQYWGAHPMTIAAGHQTAIDAAKRYNPQLDYEHIGGEPIPAIEPPVARPPDVATQNPLGRAVRTEMGKPDVPFVDRRDRALWAAPTYDDTTEAPLTPSSFAHGMSASGVNIARGIPAFAGNLGELGLDALDAVAPGAGRIKKTKVWNSVANTWDDIDAIAKDTVSGIKDIPQINAAADRERANPDRGFFEKATQDPSYLMDQAADQIPQMAAMYFTGGGIGLASKAAAAAVPMSMEAQETREAIKQYELETGTTLDSTEKNLAIIGKGIVAGAMERFSADTVLGRISSRLSPKARVWFLRNLGAAGTRLAESTITEGVTENLQNTAGNAALIALGIKNPDKLFEGSSEAGLLGATMGLLMSAGTGGTADFSKKANEDAIKLGVLRIAQEEFKKEEQRQLKLAPSNTGTVPPTTGTVTPPNTPPNTPPVTSPATPLGPEVVPPAGTPGPQTPPPAGPIVNESIEPPIQQTVDPVAPSMLPPVTQPAIVEPFPEPFPQQPVPLPVEQPVAPEQPMPPEPQVVAPPEVAPIPTPAVVPGDPMLTPTKTQLLLKNPDGSTVPVTFEGMQDPKFALVTLPDGTITPTGPANLYTTDGVPLAPVKPPEQPKKPAAPVNVRETIEAIPGAPAILEGIYPASTVPSKWADHKIGDMVALHSDGKPSRLVGFGVRTNDKGLNVPVAILEKKDGLFAATGIVRARVEAPVAGTAETAPKAPEMVPPGPTPVETPGKPSPEAETAPRIDSNEVPPAPLAAPPLKAPESRAGASTAAQEIVAPKAPAATVYRPKVGDMVTFSHEGKKVIGKAVSRDGDSLHILGTDGKEYDKADIKLQKAGTAAEEAAASDVEEKKAEEPKPAKATKAAEPKGTRKAVATKLKEASARGERRSSRPEDLQLKTSSAPTSSVEVENKEEAVEDSRRESETGSPGSPVVAAPASSGAAPTAAEQLEKVRGERVASPAPAKPVTLNKDGTPRKAPTSVLNDKAEVAKVKAEKKKAKEAKTPEPTGAVNAEGVAFSAGDLIAYHPESGPIAFGRVLGIAKQGAVRLEVEDSDDPSGVKTILMDPAKIDRVVEKAEPGEHSVFDDEKKAAPAPKKVVEVKPKPVLTAPKPTLAKDILGMMRDIAAGKPSLVTKAILEKLRAKTDKTMPQKAAQYALDGGRARVAMALRASVAVNPTATAGMIEAIALEDDAKLLEYLDNNAKGLAGILRTVAGMKAMKDVKNPASTFLASILKGPAVSHSNLIAATFKPTAEGITRRGLAQVVNDRELALYKGMNPRNTGGSIGIVTGERGSITFASMNDGFILDVDMGNVAELMQDSHLSPLDIEMGRHALGKDDAKDAKDILNDATEELNSYVNAHPIAFIGTPGGRATQVALVSEDGVVNMGDAGLVEHLVDRGASFKFANNGNVVVAFVKEGKANKVIGHFAVSKAPGGTYNGFALPKPSVIATVREMIGQDTTNDQLEKPTITMKTPGVYRKIPMRLEATRETTDTAKTKSTWAPAEAAVYDIFAAKEINQKLQHDDVMRIVSAFQDVYGDIEILPIFSEKHAEFLNERGLITDEILTHSKDKGVGGMFSAADGRTVLYVEHLNADKVSPVRALLNTLVHETIGHYGLQRFMDNVEAFTSGVWAQNEAAILADSELQKAYAPYWERLPFVNGAMDAAKYAKLIQPHLDRETLHSEHVREIQRQIAEEWMMKNFEKVVAERVAGRLKNPPKWYEKIIVSIRDFINKILANTEYGKALGIGQNGGVRFIDVEQILSSKAWEEGRLQHLDVLKRIESMMAEGKTGLELSDFEKMYNAGSPVDPNVFIRAARENDLSKFARVMLAMPEGRSKISWRELKNHLEQNGIDEKILADAGLADAMRRKPAGQIAADSVDTILNKIARNPNTFPVLTAAYDMGQRGPSIANRRLFTAFDKMLNKGMFVGEAAAENLDDYVGSNFESQLKIAQADVAAGKNAEDVRKATGWKKGPDGKWRFEISDNGAYFKKLWDELPPSTGLTDIMLGQVLNHKELFKAYPELRRVSIRKASGDEAHGHYGWFDGTLNQIVITDQATDDLSTLLHEIQHWVQLREGFANGADVDTVFENLTRESQEDVRRDLIAKARTSLDVAKENAARYELAMRIWNKHRTLVDAARDADAEFEAHEKKSGPEYDRLAKAMQKADDALKDKLRETEPSDNDGTPEREDILHLITNSQYTRPSLERKLDVRRDFVDQAEDKLAEVEHGDIKTLQKVIARSGGLYGLYKRVAGEREARVTQKRMGMTDAQRAERDPDLDADIVEKDVLFSTYGKSGSMLSKIAEEPARTPAEEAADAAANEAFEKRAIKAKGIHSKESWKDRVAKSFLDTKQIFTQAFPHLYTTTRPQDAVTNDALRLLRDAPTHAATVAGNVVRDITAGLDRDQEYRMGLILALRDIVAQEKENAQDPERKPSVIPFGIESLEQAIGILRTQEAGADAAILEALEKRKIFMKDYVDKLIENGLLDESHSKDPDTYFRRQTLYYYEMSDAAARSWGIKRKLLPAKHGMFKKRTGPGAQSINAETNDFRRRVKEFDARLLDGWKPTKEEQQTRDRMEKEISNREADFNTNYRQMEFEHIAAGYHTIRAMEVIKELRESVDEGAALRAEARTMNLLHAYGGGKNHGHVLALLEEARGLKTTGKEGARKKEIAEELDQIDPLAASRRRMGQGIAMLGAALKHDGIPPNLPGEHRFIAEELVRKAMTKKEREEHDALDDFDASQYSWSDAEEGSLFGLMKWLDREAPGHFSGIGLIYKAMAERQQAIKEAVEASGEVFQTAATRAAATGSAPILASEIEKKTGKEAAYKRAKLVSFSPNNEHMMFRVMTVGDRILKSMIDKMEAGSIDDVSKEAMANILLNAKPQLAFGPLAEEWFIPENIARQLNEFGKNNGGVGSGADVRAKMVAYWKLWKLQGPGVIKYNINNMFGDLDVVLASYPEAMKEVKQAIVDLRRYHGTAQFRKNFKRDATIMELEELTKYGMISSGMNSTELADLDQELTLSNEEWSKNPIEVSGRILANYFATVGKYSTARENILRLAMHRYLTKMVKKNGGLLPMGASSGAELRMMTEGFRIAADRLTALGKPEAAKRLLTRGAKAQIDKVSRELLGDYGNISYAGQFLRRGPIPFVSWLEINAPRYGRLLRNSWSDKTMGLEDPLEIGKRAGISAAINLTRGAKTVVKMHLLMAAISLWNHFLFGDDEEELGTGRGQMHVLLGHNKDGSIASLRAQGALSDVYGWVGFENPLDDIRRYRAGEVSASALFGYEPAKSVITKLVNGFDPFSKGLFEGLTGSKFFPSVFKEGEGFERDRRYSRDGIIEGFVNSVVGNPAPAFFKWLNNTPPRTQGLMDYFLTYRTDPREQAFWRAKDLASAWVEKTGIGNPAGSSAPLTDAASSARYKYRKAIQYGWPELADYWASQYFIAGGKPSSLLSSIKMAGPLSGIPMMHRKQFYESLNPAQRKTLKMAVDWYETEAVKMEETVQKRPEYPEALREQYAERKRQAHAPRYPKGVDKHSTFIPGVTLKGQYVK